MNNKKLYPYKGKKLNADELYEFATNGISLKTFKRRLSRLTDTYTIEDALHTEKREMHRVGNPNESCAPVFKYVDVKW